MHNRTVLVAAHILACVAVVGCSKSDKTADTAAVDTTRHDSAATAAAPAPAPAMNDANIVAFIEEANTADSANGKVASTKGTNAAVKEYGRTMMRDHGALNKSVGQLAKKDSITPAPAQGDSLPQMAKKMTDSLNAQAKGAAWDKAYIAGEVSTHQMVLSKLQEAQNAAQKQDLKDAIGKAIPTIQAHLQKAQDIQTKLGSS